MLQRGVNGFTMVELIIAIALTVLIVFAVFSVTNSTSRLAREQERIAREQARTAVVLDFLRRDLRGWMAPREARHPTRPEPAHDREKVLLQFNTTADGLAGDLLTGQDAYQSRTDLQIQYILREGLYAREFVRREMTSLGEEGALCTELLKTQETLQVRFFDGQRWLDEWKGNEAPVALQIEWGEHRHTIAR